MHGGVKPDGGAIAAGIAPRETERTYRAAAAALRLRIWDPVAAAIAGASRVCSSFRTAL